ncbi:MAG TPA: hypothetical protein VGZ00_04695, partial [Candidatus Baltobacteraceae bacterium]|nr:hypothetical protein [Candidatus Baltobacteraceae bacterium]
MLIDVRKSVKTTESGHESLPPEQDEPKGAFESAQVFSYIQEALESSQVHEAGAEAHFRNVRSRIEEMLEEALFEESVLLLQTRPSLEGVDDILDERFRTLIPLLRERLGEESSHWHSKIASIPHPPKSEPWYADRKAINKQHIAVVSAYIGLENVCYD